MSIFPKITFGKKKFKREEKREIKDTIQDALTPYITKKELEDYLQKIESDKKKRQIWNSLSARKQIAILRYVSSKKEGLNEKKRRKLF